jgi:murein DD-endopeptidase MepM/ murein hydrolase activator NlpD
VDRTEALMRRSLVLLVLAAAAAAPLAGQAVPSRTAPPAAPKLPPLPDPTGWGVHVLALARGPDSSIWVGTYGAGILVWRPGAEAWEQIRSDTTRTSISLDFVHAFGFVGREVWYGTVGNGWGVSRDGGRTWRNWQFRELGPRWLYVAPNGIVTRGDTVFVATADGIRWTTDHGTNWREVNDSTPGGLPSRYVLTAAPARGGGLWVSTLRGIGRWEPATGYRPAAPSPLPALGARIRAVFPVDASQALAPFVPGSETCAGTLRPPRGRPAPGARPRDPTWECMGLFERAGVTAAVRALAGCEGVLCAGATSVGALYSTRTGLTLQPTPRNARARDVYAVLTPHGGQPGDTVFGTACGILGQQSAACLADGDTAGVRAPAAPLHTWLARPIAPRDQPHIDQTYRYGSTMGGFFQQHQGVEFNNPVGTPVLAADAGTVVHAGPGEQDALAVTIRHDSVLVTPEGRFFLYTVYYHNSALLVHAGQRVTRGQAIARVGATGRATNDHLHFEVHASPLDSARLIVDPANRYPPYTRNPELWLEPLPGTGTVAGRVLDGQGRPVQQARIYGIVKPEPQETPHSFIETYGARTRGDPAYDEHFAVTDVPAGEYVLGVTIEGRQVLRRVRVEAGRLTWVEFR